MNNRIRNEMNKIDIPKELSDRSRRGIIKVKQEVNKSRPQLNFRKLSIVTIIITLLTLMFIYGGFHEDLTTLFVNESDVIKIPKTTFADAGSSDGQYLPFIVYNGDSYIETNTEINFDDAKDILDKYLGTTATIYPSIVKQSEIELGSLRGNEDVYTLKGYDPDFRIISYKEGQYGMNYAKVYEKLNDLTIRKGGDFFKKLNLAGNVSSVYYRNYMSWNNEHDNWHKVLDEDIIERFIVELNKTKPVHGNDMKSVNFSLSNNNFRELAIHLDDGLVVKLNLYDHEGGYIYYYYYGYFDVYFKMDQDIFKDMWDQLSYE